MKISSSFPDNSFIPVEHSRNGGDISPPISIEDIPPSTISLVLICTDIDAQTGGFIHWLVWNLPRNTTNIVEGSVPSESVSGVTDWGENHWGGPQPPNGTHRYVFTVYALDIFLNLPQSSRAEDILIAIKSHILDSASVTGLYNA